MIEAGRARDSAEEEGKMGQTLTFVVHKDRADTDRAIAVMHLDHTHVVAELGERVHLAMVGENALGFFSWSAKS